MGRKSFDTASFGEGLLEGVMKRIDAQAKEKQRELDLQRDVTKHILMKKADMEMNKSWLEDMQSKIGGQQQGFVKESPMTGMAKIFGPGMTPEQARPTPFAMTEETPTGRQPMTEHDIDYGAVGRAQEVKATPTSATLQPMSRERQEQNLYQILDQKKRQGQRLSPQAESRYQALKNKFEGQQPIVDATGKTIGYRPKGAYTERDPKGLSAKQRSIIGEIRKLKNNNATIEDINEHIRIQGYEPEDFTDEIQGYEPQEIPASMRDEIWKFVTSTGTQKVSQVLNFIMQKFNTSRDKAIEIIRSMQGAS